MVQIMMRRRSKYAVHKNDRRDHHSLRRRIRVAWHRAQLLGAKYGACFDDGDDVDLSWPRDLLTPHGAVPLPG